MKTLPVFLDVHNKACLVVGEGDVAVRKARLLTKAGATVRHVSKSFCLGDLDGVTLVIAASGDPELDQHVSQAAQARSIPVNVVDQPALCTFIFPSIIERGDITVAVSSGGVVPVLTRLLRARLETLLPPSLAEFAAMAGSWRKHIKQHLPDMQQRLRFWDQLLQEQMIGAGGDISTRLSEAGIQQLLESFSTHNQGGCVFVVGAGPGDPDLLTFKALRCLQACDVVVFDEHVDQRIVELARRDAHRVRLENQQHVLGLLLSHVAQRGHVVYLLAGDPGSYRELQALLMSVSAAGVPVHCVPGVAG
ncbi:MAG TPA: NAD(P)-dependent oxidoreductase [Pseudomonadales bacterium]|nr:NAD(P)-dependent oxidoreductase [Pseudomonadales bacterium]